MVQLRRRAAIISSATLVMAFLLAVTGSVILKSLGTFMSSADGIRRSEVAVITPESGVAGELEAADLFQARMVERVVVLVPAPGPAVRELNRRGVTLANPTLDRLELLGVPSASLSTVAAGEGGTTESASAVAAWVQEHPVGDVLVITSPTHARRIRRTLRREMRGRGPVPSVCVAQFHGFRADNWWRSRSTLREGIVELEKLVLDYLRHPL